MAAKRRRWRNWQTWVKSDRLVFIDETGAKTNMARLRGRSRSGQRLHAAVPWGHWKTTTFVAGLRVDGLTAPMVLDGVLCCRKAARALNGESQPVIPFYGRPVGKTLKKLPVSGRKSVRL